MCLYAQVKGLITSDVTPQECCLPYFETRSLIVLEFTAVLLAREPQGSAWLPLSLGLQALITMPGFFMWVLGLN